MKQAEYQKLQGAISRYAQELAAAAADAGQFSNWLAAAALQVDDGEWPPQPDSAAVHERIIPRLAECLAAFRAGTSEEAFDELATAMGEGAPELWAAVHEGDGAAEE